MFYKFAYPVFILISFVCAQSSGDSNSNAFSNASSEEDSKTRITELNDQLCSEMQALKTINEQLEQENQITKESGASNYSAKYKWGKRKVLVQKQIKLDKQEYKKLSGKIWSSKECNSSN